LRFGVRGRHFGRLGQLENVPPQLEVAVFEFGVELIDADAGGLLVGVVTGGTIFRQEGFDVALERRFRRIGGEERNAEHRDGDDGNRKIARPHETLRSNLGRVGRPLSLPALTRSDHKHSTSILPDSESFFVGTIGRLVVLSAQSHPGHLRVTARAGR
jgi:hypothetical protein